MSEEATEVEEVKDATEKKEWDYICGTSDVVSNLSRGIAPDGRIWLHFEFGEAGYLNTPLDDFLIMYRLFNMTFYSHLAKLLDLCLNPQCHNMPYGGHQRKENCVPIATFQKEILENDDLEMRRLQAAESIKKPIEFGAGSHSPQ